MSFTQYRLEEVAQINPRVSRHLAPDDLISFVPMSALDAETGKTTQGEDRAYQEVSKGYTGFWNGDLLVAKITPCFENGKIGQADLKHDFGFGSTEFHVVRPDAAVLDARYLFHYLRQKSIRIAGEKKMTGSGGQRRVPAQYLAELKISVPPLPEQKRIAAILDQAESLRAKRRAALVQLDALAQAIFIEMFGDPVSNPNAYAITELADLIVPERPLTYGILMPGDNQDEGVPYVRVVDMKAGGVDVSQVRKTTREISEAYKRSLLDAGDLLLSIRGHVGRLAIVPDALSGANITQDTARLSVDRKRANPIFVLEQLRSRAIQGWMQKHVKGVAVKGINLGDVRRIPMVMPPAALQREFELRVKAIEVLQEKGRQSRMEADALFSSLQHRAFRGEL